MVSTITPANASQDLLEIAVRLVRLPVVTNNQYILFLLFLFLSLIIGIDKKIYNPYKFKLMWQPRHITLCDILSGQSFGCHTQRSFPST